MAHGVKLCRRFYNQKAAFSFQVHRKGSPQFFFSGISVWQFPVLLLCQFFVISSKVTFQGFTEFAHQFTQTYRGLDAFWAATGCHYVNAVTPVLFHIFLDWIDDGLMDHMFVYIEAYYIGIYVPECRMNIQVYIYSKVLVAHFSIGSRSNLG